MHRNVGAHAFMFYCLCVCEHACVRGQVPLTWVYAVFTWVHGPVCECGSTVPAGPQWVCLRARQLFGNSWKTLSACSTLVSGSLWTPATCIRRNGGRVVGGGGLSVVLREMSWEPGREEVDPRWVGVIRKELSGGDGPSFLVSQAEANFTFCPCHLHACPVLAPPSLGAKSRSSQWPARPALSSHPHYPSPCTPPFTLAQQHWPPCFLLTQPGLSPLQVFALAVPFSWNVLSS